MGSKLAINKGFILAIATIGVVSIASGLMISGSNVGANILNLTRGQSDYCNVANGSFEEVSPNDFEKSEVGDNARVYIIHTSQGKAFRVALGAKQQSGDENSGSVIFTASLQNLNDFVYTEKRGRIIVRSLSDNQIADLYYGNPNLETDKYRVYTATTPVTFSDFSHSSINLELRNGSGFYLVGCVPVPLNLKDALYPKLVSPTVSPTPSISATTAASPSATVSPSAAVSVNPTPSAIASSTLIRNKYTFKKGYNIFGNTLGTITPRTFSKVGMIVFGYNIWNRKNWTQWPADNSLFTMMPNKGYYVYNPPRNGEKTITVPIVPADEKTRIFPGWNLLWSDKDVQTKDVKVLVADSSPKSKLNVGNNKCLVQDVSLQELIDKKIGYKYIYVIVDDGATNVCKAYRILGSEDREPAKKCDGSISTLGTISKIPAGKTFWFYIDSKTMNSITGSFSSQNKCV